MVVVGIVLELSTGAPRCRVSLSLASEVVVLVALIEVGLLLTPRVVVREILIL